MADAKFDKFYFLQTTKQNVSLHISNCFKEGELDKNSVVKESLTTAIDGKSYIIFPNGTK